MNDSGRTWLDLMLCSVFVISAASLLASILTIDPSADVLAVSVYVRVGLAVLTVTGAFYLRLRPTA